MSMCVWAIPSAQPFAKLNRADDVAFGVFDVDGPTLRLGDAL
jgi:hypothetical protein